MMCHPLRCVRRVFVISLPCWLLAVAGCATIKPSAPAVRPSVAPQAQTPAHDALGLDPSAVDPMYTELVAIDLPSVLRVAGADNLDILEARQMIVADKGRFEAAVGSAFPAIVPTALFNNVEGRRVNTDGRILNVGFNSFSATVAVQWAINPGSVIYEIIAAKKRVAAAEHEADSVVMESLRQATVQFYDLVLAQATVSAADQGVDEAKELLRISKLQQATGTGVKADEMRAEARLAERQQDLVVAIERFYEASVRLATTLRLDASVTLIPKMKQLPPLQLVREDMSLQDLLEIAFAFRPDLLQVRTLVEAAAADRGKTWWSGFGPGLDVSYTYGGVGGTAKNVVGDRGLPNNLIVNPFSSNGSFSSNPLANGLFREGLARGGNKLRGRGARTYQFGDTQDFTSKIGWRLSLAAFGDLKTARAIEQQAAIDAQRRIDRISAEIIATSQQSKAQQKLIGLAHQQVAAAEEALRLSELNLQAGAMTALDVLQAQDAATIARLRYAESVVRYNQSQVNLLAALGLADCKTITGCGDAGDQAATGGAGEASADDASHDESDDQDADAKP
ncbi:MAG: TolC family protein [Phycisphaerae bacterium]